MQTALIGTVDTYADCHQNTVSLEQARSWIGCRLILRKPLLDCKPGLACIVMCVVDFGEGCLLWISTDDNRATEVDQMEIGEVLEYFRIAQTT